MTDSATSGTDILKRDKKGGVRSTAARRLEVLAQLERSGLSGPEFARVAGMPYQTLASWRQKHAKKALRLPAATPQAGARPCSSTRLMEVVAAAQPVASVRYPGLKIDLPGGASMVVADSAQAALAARLLKTLAAASPC